MHPPRDNSASHSKHEVSHGTSHAPLRSAKSQAPGFNRAWLKNGESMPALQRIGFAVISLLFLLYGLYLLQDAVHFFREGSLECLFFGIPSLGLLYFGALGLRNVLRFHHR
jgi:hypothetical protein